MKQEIQYAIELRLFDDQIIFKLIIMLWLQHYSSFQLSSCVSDDVIYCLLSEVFDS